MPHYHPLRLMVTYRHRRSTDLLFCKENCVCGSHIHPHMTPTDSYAWVTSGNIHLSLKACSALSPSFPCRCENCVEMLFVRGSGNCVQCDTPLRKSNFRVQLFEDPTVDKEVEIRKKVLKM